MRKSMFRHALPILAFAATFPLASAANAALYLFTLTGNNTASFTLNSSPVPDSTDSSSFLIQNVPGTLNGSPTTFANLDFVTSTFGGGFVAGGTSINLVGDQLFTGTVTNPTFKLGTFTLFDGAPFPNQYSLSISAVPEPATWTLLLIGFGAIGLAVRRRKPSAARFA